MLYKYYILTKKWLLFKINQMKQQCISPYMTLYSLLNHNIHLCVMNETSSLYDHLISVINQT